MSALIIDGKELASYYNNLTKDSVSEFIRVNGMQPSFSLILIGDDEGSLRYVNSKLKLATSLGIDAKIYKFDENIRIEDLKNKITELNNTSNAALIQLPLPDRLKIYSKEILELIDPAKDSDALNDYYIKNISQGKVIDLDNDVLPCTPLGVVFLIQHALELLGQFKKIANKKICVLGRSDLVGKPTALILETLGAIVQSCDSKTTEKERLNFLADSDIVVSAVGKLNFVKAEQLKLGSIVIDVGINYDNNGKMHGDVEFENAKNICAAITPVPGGVGPMTLAMLMRNVIILAKNQFKNR